MSSPNSLDLVEARGRREAAIAPRRPRSKLSRAQWWAGYGMIAPAVIILGAMSLWPMLQSLIWSFTKYSGLGDATWVGLNNYLDLFQDARFQQATLNTVIFAVVTMAIGPALGLGAAILLNRKMRGRAFYRAAFFIPVTTALVAVATVWKLLLNDSGVINRVLELFGLAGHQWLGDPNTALLAVCAASIWQGFGFEMVIFLAALQSVPVELLEAASLDGAGPWRRFWHVVLPSLRPTFIFVYVIGLIGGFQVFDQVYVMTQGGPVNSTLTIVYYLIDRFRGLDLGHASAVAYVLVLILVALSYLQIRLARRWA
ncbi:MAG: sugar ABC transporter permease [Cryobacterium sp.]|nr:sugar ABC transporter permease [Cryobacterium sp.]